MGDWVPLFSVVVPVYNVEPYIGECVTSILDQTLEDIELILVDDGSTDGSGAICDHYASLDSRVTVVHQSNQGLSSARNSGMRVASGEYLVYADGDDFYADAGFFRDLYDHLAMRGYPDLVAYGRTSYWPHAEQYVPDSAILDERLNGLDVVTVLGRLIETASLSISACTRAVNRQFAIEKGLYFQVGLLSEDLDWSLRVFDRCTHMSIMNRKPYVYRRARKGSITQSVGLKHMHDGIAMIRKYACEYEYSCEAMRNVLLGFVAYEYCVFCGNLVHLPRAQRREAVDQLRPLRWLLEWGSNPKVRAARMARRILGFRMTVWLLGQRIRVMCR